MGILSWEVPKSVLLAEKRLSKSAGNKTVRKYTRPKRRS